MDMFGLFELAGLEVEVKEPVKKEKKAVEKKDKKKASVAKVETKKYKLPIKLWYNDGSLIIPETDEKKEMEQKEVYQYVKEHYPMLSDYDVQDIVSGVGVLIPKKYLFGNKGALHLTEETEIYLGTTLLEKPSLSGEVQLEELLKALNLEKCLFRCVDEKEIRLLFDGENPLDTIKLPFTLDVLGEEVVLTKKPVLQEDKSSESDSEESDEVDVEEENEAEDMAEMADSEAEKAEEMSLKDIFSYVAKEKGLPQKNLSLVKRGDKYKILFKNAMTTQATTKKEIMYDTSFTLSLGWTKIVLNAEMFDGQSEVKSGDIIKFLSKAYPEYSKERTELVIDEKARMIIAILKGSRKGALPIEITEEGVVYRAIDTPVASVKVAMDGSGKGEYFFRLPKIPIGILECIESMFSTFTKDHNRELLVRLYYNVKSGYFLRIPNQVVTRASVKCEENPYYEEDILVADIHSHGTIDCSFSTTDDEDEKGERIYGVYYGFPYVKSSFRLGSGGHFLYIDITNITDLSNHVWPQTVYGEVKIY